jgi:hypothetical protein
MGIGEALDLRLANWLRFRCAEGAKGLETAEFNRLLRVTDWYANSRKRRIINHL